MDREGGNATLHSLVEENLSQYEDRVAVLYDTGGSKEFVTYKEMWSEASLVRDALSRYSVTREVVGLCLEQDNHIPAVILGILCSGAAFYNFEPASTDFVLKVIQDIHIRLLVIDIKFLNTLQDLILQFNGQLSPFCIPGCPHIVLVELLLVTRKPHYSNLAYCITTSGTTGRPKIVQVPHCCIVPNIIDIRRIYNLTSDDIVLLCSPLTFDPCIVELFTSLIVGACVLIVPDRVKTSPEMLLEITYHRNKVTVMQCTPSLVRRWNPARVKETILGQNFSLRVMSLGGERFPAFSELERLKGRGNQTKFYNLYGITEVSSWATCYEVTDFGKEAEVHLGFPLLDTELKVCDDSGHRIEEDIGRIYIGGKSRQCIIGPEEETQYNLSQIKWRDTGDIGRRTKDGCIYYIGREDSQIKRHGKRLNLEEINEVIRGLEFVRCCTTQLIDNRLVVFIVTDLPTSQLEPADDHFTRKSTDDDNTTTIKTAVIDRLRCQLPSHYTPDDVVVIDNLPVTKHGKVDISELIMMYKNSQEHLCKDIKPLECLTRGWKEVLSIDRADSVSDGSLFLEAGGDSFKAVKLLDNIESQLKCKFPSLLDWIMSKPFRVLCEYINAEYKNYQNVTLDKAGNIETEKELNKMNFTEKDMFSESSELDKEVSSPDPIKIDTDKTNVFQTKDDRFEMVNEVTVGGINSLPPDRSRSVKFKDRNIILAPYVTNSDVFKNQLTADSLNYGNSISNVSDTNEKRNVDDTFVTNEVLNYSNKDTQKLHKLGNSLDSITSIKAYKKRPLAVNPNYFHDIKLKNRKIQQQKFYKFIQRGNKMYYTFEGNRTGDNVEEETTTPDKPNITNKDSEVEANELRELKTRGIRNVDKIFDADRVRRIGHYDCTDSMLVELKERWRYNTGKCVDASPLLAVSRDEREDMVFIGSHSNKFSAVSMATGSAVWEITLGDRIESSACMSWCGNYVIVGCYDGFIYTIDTQTGGIYWKFVTGAEIKSSPMVDMATGLVYVGSHRQCLYALNVERRQYVWIASPGCGSIFSSPTVWHSPHMVYVGTLGGYLLAFHALTGKEVWRHNLGKPIFSSPCVTDNGIIVGCVDNFIYHVSHTGTLLWKFESKGPVFSSPAIWNYCSEMHHLKEGLASDDMETCEIDSKPSEKLSCCDRLKSDDDHAHEEEISGASAINSQLFYEKRKRIVCGCHGDRVCCLTGDGKLIWEIETDSPVYSTPFVDRIYMTDQHCDCESLNTASSSENQPSSCSEVFESNKKEWKPCHKTYFPGNSNLYCDEDTLIASELDKASNFRHSNTSYMRKCLGNCSLQGVDVAAFASTKGNLYLVKVEDGTVLCKFQMEGEIFSSPVLYRNCLVVGCRNDMVYCFDITVKARERNSIIK